MKLVTNFNYHLKLLKEYKYSPLSLEGISANLSQVAYQV